MTESTARGHAGTLHVREWEVDEPGGAVVLSGPVIGTLEGFTELLGLETIPSDPLDAATLSRDEEVGRVYDEDPLVWHGPFKRRTLLGFADLPLELALDADTVTGPVLWQHGADTIAYLAAATRG